MILVTGAAGKTGRAVIRALAGRGAGIRALVHHPEQRGSMADLGAQETIVGDMRSQPTMDQASRGIRAIYHICPNVSPDEAAIGQIIIAAARSAGVQHLVYHSVLHPQTQAMPHHWLKLRVEEKLLESGLPYTVLQPAAYMQNVLAHWDKISKLGLYPVPYSAETKLGMVDLEDVAEAAAVVLTEAGHEGATYELAGPEVLSQTEVAAILGERLGRPVRLSIMSPAEWDQQARSGGLDKYQIQALASMFHYYDRHGFWGNPRVLGWLLRRPPTTFAAFVQRSIREQPAG